MCLYVRVCMSVCAGGYILTCVCVCLCTLLSVGVFAYLSVHASVGTCVGVLISGTYQADSTLCPSAEDTCLITS